MMSLDALVDAKLYLYEKPATLHRRYGKAADHSDVAGGFASTGGTRGSLQTGYLEHGRCGSPLRWTADARRGRAQRKGLERVSKSVRRFLDRRDSAPGRDITRAHNQARLMVTPASGPFLFDTSAESWLARSRDAAVRGWFRDYLSMHQVHVSAVTVVERIRGYALLARRAPHHRLEAIETARVAYLSELGRIWPLDGAIGIVAGEVMAILPSPPTPPRRAHQLVESRQERLVRWRFDAMIAATALVTRMTLIHNNAADLESIRGAIERSPERFPALGPLDLIRCDSLV